MLPPKPPARSGRVSLWRYMRLFRQDILSAQPAHLYRAWMAEFRTPFFRSYLCNQPDLVDLVLKERPDDFPKSDRIREGLAPLLGNSVFVTNGETWKRQRRIIDPAFEGGRLRDVFPAMLEAGQAAVARLASTADGAPQEIEAQASHAAADVIFRTLFSIPIEHEVAAQVFDKFREHQRAQPVLNLGAFMPLPNWFPRFHKRRARQTAADIRALITRLTAERMARITDGTAPDDLATKIMTTADPQTGQTFDTEEMVDQVAIFFLAGHETSASALAWALYLLALYPDWQERVAKEARQVMSDGAPEFSDIGKLRLTRDIFRETLRLYPPVPMMVREAACPERFRDREVPKGAQIVLSPWHQQRHERLWDNPDAFDPVRFQTENGREGLRCAYMPFSAGQRVCPGAGFAMIEGPLLLALLVRAYRFDTVTDRPAMPVAHLTVRGRDGIWLRVRPRT
ncbi:cytochrome P450 [Roseovarius sp. PS-C2]|uniref:cytochrome P450 n=1 Tax=Roseovarius sp. PS-C2 TaxID=2820814 RepID=UPI001C0AD09A|nr:cytochrome P450 [Roseovarius sp. PS-C2]MBU3259587.1 cytochrome P450 [Roseovarius sp. PS-C2]